MKQNTISFLGEILSAEGIRPSDDIISVINNMMKPQNREEVTVRTCELCGQIYC